MNCKSVSLTLVLLLFTSQVVADEVRGGGKTVRVSVPADGGVDYELSVHSDYVTNLYFPEDVERAWNSNQDAFDVTGKGKVLHIRARTDKPADGNIAVVTASLKVGIHILVGAKKDAVFQVFFERPDADSEREKAVAKRVLAEKEKLRQRYKEKLSGLTADYSELLLEAVSKRASTYSIKGIARSDSHVIVRLEKVVYVGDVGHLVFDVQNRSGREFFVDRAEVVAKKKNIGGKFVVSGEGDNVVADGKHAKAVVQFSAIGNVRSVALVVRGRNGGSIRVGDVRLP